MKECCPVIPITPTEQCPWGPAIVRGRTNAQLCFPEFCFTDENWVGASYIVYRFFIANAADRLAIANLRRFQTDDYVLAVTDGDDHYQFWEVAGVNIPGTLYAGEPLSGDAVFEIWTTPNAESLVVNAFCVPMSYVEPPCGVAPLATYSPGGNKKLWALFCSDTGTPVTGTGFNYAGITFSLEKDC